jgi:hypothetical protein
MKLITLFVGNKADHVIHFDAADNDAPETYIVAADQASTELFAFYHSIGSQAGGRGSDIILQTDKGQGRAYITKISLGEESGADKLTVMVELSCKPVNVREVVDPSATSTLEFDMKGKNRWPVRLKDGVRNPKPVDVVFVLTDESGKEFSKTLAIWAAPIKAISDVVFDYGSEASQMAIFDRDNEETLHSRRPIFEEMKDLFGVTETAGKGSRYVQADSQTEDLFRSVFYVKQKFDSTEINAMPIPEWKDKKLETDKVLRILTTEQEAQELTKEKGFIVMPNAKITAFGGVRLPRIYEDGDGFPISDYKSEYGDDSKEKYFYRATINHFIFCALKKVRRPCVCFYILMPNVYTQQEVFANLHYLRKDIGEMLKKNDVINKRVKCVELSVVSESDASMLGAIDLIKKIRRQNGESPLQQGIYLMLDAGKGTLDFSAIEYKTQPREQYLSRYRSGIIGAGNALTYAYMYALLYDFSREAVDNYSPKDDDLYCFICNNLLGSDDEGVQLGGGDLANLNKLMRAVDRYKVSVGKEKCLPDKNINAFGGTGKLTQLSAAKMDAFITYVEEMVKGDTYKPLSAVAQSYVDGTIAQITAGVCSKLVGGVEHLKDQIKGVIFAGRGFLHPKLKTTVYDCLKKSLGVTQEFSYTGKEWYAGTEKNVCLFVRQPLLHGAYNNHMMCVPSVKKDKGQPDSTTQERGILDFLSERLPNIGGNNNFLGAAVNFLGKIDSRPESYGMPGDVTENGLVTGFAMTIEQNDTLILAGREYSIDPGKVTIFYAGDDILVRYDNENRVLPITNQGVNLVTSPLVFPTLFPFVKPEEENSISVVPLKASLPQEDNSGSQNRHTSQENGLGKTPEQGTGKPELQGEKKDETQPDTGNTSHGNGGGAATLDMVGLL